MLRSPFLVAVLSLSLLAPAAADAGRTATTAASCGTETALSRGQVFRIKTSHVGCRTGKRVAGGWFNVQSQGDDASRVYEGGRAWRCRITEHGTGTDPGYNPYTSVRCTRHSARVNFKLRS